MYPFFARIKSFLTCKTTPSLFEYQQILNESWTQNRYTLKYVLCIFCVNNSPSMDEPDVIPMELTNQGIAEEIWLHNTYRRVRHRIIHTRLPIKEDQYILLEPGGYGRVSLIGCGFLRDQVVVKIAFRESDICTVYVPFWVPASLIQDQSDIRQALCDAQQEEPPPYLQNELPPYEEEEEVEEVEESDEDEF